MMQIFSILIDYAYISIEGKEHTSKAIKFYHSFCEFMDSVTTT